MLVRHELGMNFMASIPISGPVNLSVMTHYSYRAGAMTVAEAVSRAKEIGATSIGFMERNLGGALDIAAACKKAGIKPVLGVRIPFEFERKSGGSIVSEIGLVALTEQGWVNISNAISLSQMAPAGGGLKLADLLPLREGVALTTGFAGSGLGYNLARLAEAEPGARRAIANWLANILPSAWGRDRFYIEIERPYRHPGQEAHEAFLLDAATAHGCRIVGASDVRYDRPANHVRWEIIQANEAGDMVSIDDLRRQARGNSRIMLHHIRDQVEMDELFVDLPEADAGARALAASANYAPGGKPAELPSWPEATKDHTEDDILRETCEIGLRKLVAKLKYPIDEKVYWDRLDYEISVIQRMKFSGYFLMVSEFMRWAADNDIPLGPGRGSGAGSIVAWSLGVTKLDPLRYGLLFERFLNPNRVSMPDFDVDVCVDGRSRVIEHIAERWGHDRVVQIANYNEIKAKGAIRLAARTITNDTGGKMSFDTVDALANNIKDENDKLLDADKKTVSQMIEMSMANNLLVAGRERTSQINDLGINVNEIILDLAEAADGLQGVYNNLGVHASGIIISPCDLKLSGIPLLRMPDSEQVMCSYDMKAAEKAGLVKFDILGLAAVTIIDAASRLVRRRLPGFDIDEIDLDDPAVYENFRLGLTAGVFQFSSSGMKNVLKQIQTSNMGDLIAAVSLYRPGPMAYIDNYAARKSGEEKFQYYHPTDKNKEVLAETYGIMVYQEQVMRVVQNSGGFSLAAADEMRRAIGKKNLAEIERLKDVFIGGDEAAGIPGALKLGMSRHEAEALYADIRKFSEYGFNKSHAAAYALVAYMTMWLKTHYPAEFLTAAMEREGDKDSMQELRDETRKLGVTTLPPDINDSGMGFYCDPEGRFIRYGMSVGKGINDFPQEFWDERDRGRFASIEDFCTRLYRAGQKLSIATGKATLEPAGDDKWRPEHDPELLVESKSILRKNQRDALVAMGAFDAMQPNRRMALAEIDGWLGYLEGLRKAMRKRPKKLKAPKVPGRKGRAGAAEAGGEAVEAAPVDQYEPQPMPDRPVFSDLPEWEDVASREFAICGGFITRHPLDGVSSRVQRAGILPLGKIMGYMDSARCSDVDVRACVIVSDVKVKIARSGNSYISLRIAGADDSMPANLFQSFSDKGGVLWSRQLAVLGDADRQRRPVVIRGNFSQTSATIRQVWPIDPVISMIESRDGLIATMANYDTNEDARAEISSIVEHFGAVKSDNGRCVSLSYSVAGGERREIAIPGRFDLDSVEYRYNIAPLLSATSLVEHEPNIAERALILGGGGRRQASDQKRHPARSASSSLPPLPKIQPRFGGGAALEAAPKAQVAQAHIDAQTPAAAERPASGVIFVPPSFIRPQVPATPGAIEPREPPAGARTGKDRAATDPVKPNQTPNAAPGSLALTQLPGGKPSMMAMFGQAFRPAFRPQEPLLDQDDQAAPPAP